MIQFAKEKIYFIERRFLPNFLSAVCLGFNSWYQKNSDDLRAQTVHGHCYFLQISVWHIIHLATTTKDRVGTSRNIFHWNPFLPNMSQYYVLSTWEQVCTWKGLSRGKPVFVKCVSIPCCLGLTNATKSTILIWGLRPYLDTSVSHR